MHNNKRGINPICIISIIFITGVSLLIFQLNRPEISYAARNSHNAVSATTKDGAHSKDTHIPNNLPTPTNTSDQSQASATSTHLDDYMDHLKYYIEQITHFYVQVITILLAEMGVLLVLGFLFIQLTTKRQIEDSVSDTLNTPIFQSHLESLVEKKIAEVKGEDQVTLDDLEARVASLEKMVTQGDYKIGEAGSE